MLKRVLMVGLAAGAALVTLHSGPARAATYKCYSNGWCYVTPPGTYYYYGSIDACATIQQVRNPDQFPAQLYCSIEVTKVESLCYNPNNHNVVPGEAATQVVFSAGNGIGWDDLVDKSQKTKNTAALCAKVTSADADCELYPGSELCNPAYCVNKNWKIKKVLTSEFTATCQTQVCSGTIDSNTGACTGNWATKDTQRCECTLPPPYSIENPPPHCADPLRPTADCVAYECWELDASGGRTGNLCMPQ
jgi:hypothetical protein